MSRLQADFLERFNAGKAKGAPKAGKAKKKGKDWPEEGKRYAAMVSMVDRQVGELFALLKELGLDEQTLVFFSGDNGAADYFSTKNAPPPKTSFQSANDPRHPWPEPT